MCRRRVHRAAAASGSRPRTRGAIASAPRPSPGSDASTCAADAAIDSTAQRVTAARSVASARSASSAMVPAMSAGARSAAIERVDNREPRDRRRGHEQLVEIRITPLAAALLDQPPTGDVAEEPHPAERAEFVAEPGGERRVRGVGRRPFVPDEQPGTRGHERRVAAAPASTADAVSCPPTRCTGTPRHFPTNVPAGCSGGRSDDRHADRDRRGPTTTCERGRRGARSCPPTSTRRSPRRSGGGRAAPGASGSGRPRASCARSCAASWKTVSIGRACSPVVAKKWSAPMRSSTAW